MSIMWKVRKKKETKFKFLQEIVNTVSTKEGQITTMKFSNNGKYLAIGSNDFDIRVYEIPIKTK